METHTKNFANILAGSVSLSHFQLIAPRRTARNFACRIFFLSLCRSASYFVPIFSHLHIHLCAKLFTDKISMQDFSNMIKETHLFLPKPFEMSLNFSYNCSSLFCAYVIFLLMLKIYSSKRIEQNESNTHIDRVLFRDNLFR